MTVRTPMITLSEKAVVISGIACTASPPLMKPSSFSCSACTTSFTPMKARMIDRP